ncbi:MAG: cytochrome C oxidase subunit IV family protein [Acidimicrobiales bacterium]
MSTHTERDEAAGPVVEVLPEEGGAHHDHPSEAKYIRIALLLAAITAVEVAFSYWDAVDAILAPSLIAMSIVKFVIVVGYFMHLKFDSRLFRRLFVAGLALAVFCFGVVLTTFHVWTR